MSTLSVTTITGANTIKSGTASTPPTIQDSNGTQVGTFCRAWVNFNGTGTVAIRASFNVTSITDNGTGDYTVNFTTAMPDANYSASGQSQGVVIYQGTGSTSTYRIQTYTFAAALLDYTSVSIQFFR